MTATVAAGRPGARPSRVGAAPGAPSPERRLAEAFEQQQATDEILRVMAASPGNVQPVLDAVAERAARLCESPFARVVIVEGDVLRAVAIHSTDGSSQPRTTPLPLKRTAITGRAVLDRATIHYEDIVPLLDTEYPDAVNARLLGLRAVLAVPLMRESEAYGAIFLFRREPRAFSREQVALVETFARQAAIAIDNARLFKETKEALEQQTAMAEILRVISSAPGNLSLVLTAVAERAVRLCEAEDATIFLTHDDELRAAARFGPATGAVEVGQSIPLTRGSVTGRAIIDRVAVHMADLAAAPEDEFPLARQLQRQLGHRATLSVPLMREDRAIGAIALWRWEARQFTDRQVDLVKAFADQAAIAIENARLFDEVQARTRELSESLQQQTATADVLKVISRSAFDLRTVLDTLTESARRLCDAEGASIWRPDGDRFKVAAMFGQSPEWQAALRELVVVPGRDTCAGRALLERKTVHIHDALADPDYDVPDVLKVAGNRSMIGVPLLREGVPIGVLVLTRTVARPFTEQQIALATTFADQAVIAIENVRLFNETKEALERQIATSEILRVISQSPRDVQPVFDTIAAAALKLCNANSSVVVTRDGEWARVVAQALADPEDAATVARVFPRQLDRATAATRAMLAHDVVSVPDVLSDPEMYTRGNAQIASGFRSVLAVPLIRAGNAIGAISVGRAEPGNLPDKQVALLRTFADQAVIAIENVRLFTELEARTNQLTRSVQELKALGEVGQAVSSTLDLETVLQTIVSRASQLAGMDGGSVWEYDEEREEFHLHATDRVPAELVDVLHATPVRKGEGAMGRMAVTGEPVAMRDIADEHGYPGHLRDILARCNFRSVLTVPLLREGHLLGALVVYRKMAGDFAPDVVELLKTFATQSALAIQNARLYREIELKSGQLEIASQHKSEFLANMSHELRTPLNAIIGFSEVLSERMFGEINEKQAEYIGDILHSGQHLLSLINDILDLSKIEAGRMELELSDFDLPGTIETALLLVRERAQRRGIALTRSIDDRLGVVQADERKVKQVLLNLLSNALKFTPEGGKVDVSATVRDGGVEIAVADTGVGIAPEHQQAVFEEFRQVGTASRRVEGTGLGLAISRKFIELHGGTIWVTSKLGAGSTFAFTLPLVPVAAATSTPS